MKEQGNLTDNNYNNIPIILDNNNNNSSIGQKIKKNKSNININKQDLQKMLKEKIDNKEKGIQDIKGNAKQIINPCFFYNLWKSSFLKESYKSSMNYQKFIKMNFIKPPKEMNETLNRLLSGYYINFSMRIHQNFQAKLII